MDAKVISPERGLDGLNEAQRSVIEHHAGPLLVVAGAGTGKTKTLAARVARLIKGGADPNRIFLLTFTRRAADEMLRRAGRVVGESVVKQVQGGTFHSIAHRLLRLNTVQFGLAENFTVMDQGDAQDLLNLIRTDLGLHESKTRFPQKGALLAIYSRCINTGESLDQVMAERFPQYLPHQADIKPVFQEYTERKADRGLVDYDDLLLYWDQAIQTPGIGEAIAKQFQHILVDEYQDTNPLQARILWALWKLMRQDKTNSESEGTPETSISIMAVGDDAQSIYSFRGATVQNILRFPSQFPGTTTVTLEQNYRSTMPILKAANAVMQPAKERFTKNLWSERQGGMKPALVTCANEIAQSTFIADRILENREEGIRLMRQAVLFRAGQNSDALEIELKRRNIPFVKWGGLKFLEAAHIKDLLAFLRLLENPRDDLSWMRILQMFDGIGPGRARHIIQHLQENTYSFEALSTWSQVPAVARGEVRELAVLLQDLAGQNEQGSFPAQIERIRRFYSPLFEELYDNPEIRLRDLEQLEMLAQEARSRSSFLADLTLDPPASTGDLAGSPLLDDDYVILSTIHSAKGCEWDVVYVMHAADGVIPSDMAKGEAELEEERRLLYVAVTRARNRLYVTFPLRYYHRQVPLGDAYSTAQLSRFIPPEVFPLFDRIGFGSREVNRTREGVASHKVSASVQARIRRLWD
jgi:DNA helicase-2/ATP-dependent DNA helicase PcrA